MAKYGIAQTDEIVIVMGPAGSGKSTFIDYAIGGTGEGIGHSIKSCTSEITVHRTSLGTPPRSIAFVDTPPVDGMSVTDLQTLGKIADFLTDIHSSRLRLGRILFLHRITDNRVPILPTKALDLLMSLCNNVPIPGAVIVITMRSLGKVTEDLAKQRLNDLEGMMSSSSPLVPVIKEFEDTQDSVCNIVLGQYPISTKVSETRGEPRSAVIKDEEVIIVMGPTGSGKSTFIDYATGGTGEGVGHGMRSRTNGITTYKKTLGDPPRAITFVDTPGVDDARDAATLGIIAEYCSKMHKSGRCLNKILYLHRISDNRMTTSPVETLELFRSMLGSRETPSIVVVTTMWSLAADSAGKSRLEELKTAFSERANGMGCEFQEFGDTSKSAQEITLMSPTQNWGLAGNPPGSFSNQLVDLIKERKETNRQLKELAGRRENATVKAQLEKLDKLIAQLIEKVLKLGLSLPEAARKWLFQPQSPAGQGDTRDVN